MSGPMGTSRRDFLKRSSIRRKRTKARRVPVLRDRGYMDWLKERKCVACERTRRDLAAAGFTATNGFEVRPLSIVIDPAHMMGNGRSSKGPDSSCIPLCRHHHDEMDGRRSTAITTKAAFSAKYGLDLEKEAAAHYAAWLIVKGEMAA